MSLCLKFLNCSFWKPSPFYGFLIVWCDSKDDSDVLMFVGNAFSIPLSRLAMRITLECSYRKT